MECKQFYSSVELAKILGISRIAVFKQIKKGKIKAKKAGRNYVIERKDIEMLLTKSLNKKVKGEIDKAVKKTVSEYGETLKLLGHE